mgnify:CR=1 FL=1
MRWPDVRKGEEEWIFPYQENADASSVAEDVWLTGPASFVAEIILPD